MPRPPGRRLSDRFLILALAIGLMSLSGPKSSAQTDEGEPEGVLGRPNDAILDAPLVEPPTALAQFTTAVENREPIDQVSFVPNDVPKIFFFSDLRGLAGQTVTHRWIHEGEVRAEVPFDVRGPRWRVWSSKELLPDWIGDWTVEIVNESGEVIAAETFSYTARDA